MREAVEGEGSSDVEGEAEHLLRLPDLISEELSSAARGRCVIALHSGRLLIYIGMICVLFSAGLVRFAGGEGGGSGRVGNLTAAPGTRTATRRRADGEGPDVQVEVLVDLSTIITSLEDRDPVSSAMSTALRQSSWRARSMAPS